MALTRYGNDKRKGRRYATRFGVAELMVYSEHLNKVVMELKGQLASFEWQARHRHTELLHELEETSNGVFDNA